MQDYKLIRTIAAISIIQSWVPTAPHHLIVVLLCFTFVYMQGETA